MTSSLENIRITRIRGVYNVNFKDKRCAERKDRRFYALVYKAVGKTEYIHNGKSYIADEKHVVLIPPGKPYVYNILELGSCIQIEFESEKEVEDFEVYNVLDTVKIHRLFTELVQLWAAKSSGYKLEMLSVVYKLLHSICVFSSLDYGVQKKEKALMPAVKYIRENYSKTDISNENLADIAGMSTVYFRKLFTKRYGVSPMRYLSNIKIDAAKNLLLSNNFSVSDIAEAVGFSNVYSFSRAFKKATGQSPTEFLKNNSSFSI